MKRLFTIIAFLTITISSLDAQPKVPSSIVFASDTISFASGEMRERMERELIAFCYMHTNSVLMVKRANRYFPQIEPILRATGVPDDLKYLMAIESNVDPKAVSAAGAAGFWQFMKETAKQYGLVVDSEVDERYNTEKATRAACRYLRDAYSKYGNWMTVAASYNAGQAGVSKRLADQHQTNALDLWLPEETARYMFRILAAKMYFENPSAFGFTFTPATLYPYIPVREEITVNGSIPSLVDFAELHGVTYNQLKRANLWLRDNKLVNSAHRTFFIAIPDIDAENYNPDSTLVHSPSWVKPALYR